MFQSNSKADDNSSIFESIVLNNILEVCDKQRTISGHPVFHIVSVKMRHQFCTENKQELDYWVDNIQKELFGLPKVGIICMWYICMCIYILYSGSNRGVHF